MNATNTSLVAEETDPEGTMLLMLPPRGYQAFCVINLAVCFLAGILCVVLILSMTLPLVDPEKRKTYSVYNLYLVYLSIPDLVFNTYVIFLLLTHQMFWYRNDADSLDSSSSSNTEDDIVWMFDHSFDHNIYALCVAANLYTSAFLTYEIYVLLRNSFLRKRHGPPTIGTVTKQALVSYGIGFLAFWLEYFFGDSLAGNPVRYLVYQLGSLVFVSMVPLGVLVVVCGKIYRQKLYVSTKSMYRGRLRVLVLYFARIIVTDVLLWLPASVCYMVYWFRRGAPGGRSTAILAYNGFLLCASFQALVNFACSLTKPDARRLIVDFATLRYCGLGSFGEATTAVDNATSRTVGATTATLHGTPGQTTDTTTDPYLINEAGDGDDDDHDDDDDDDDDEKEESKDEIHEIGFDPNASRTGRPINHRSMFRNEFGSARLSEVK